MRQEPANTVRVRMSGAARREQLIDIARLVFAERGFDAASIEDIAARAGVSKPVVYEHFGGKEGLYAVVVDRELRHFEKFFAAALTASRPRQILEQSALAWLEYIEEQTDGFRILVRDTPVVSGTGTFSSLINDVALKVSYILEPHFRRLGLDPSTAGIYASMLCGMVALTGQWWLDEADRPPREVVAAHLVNLGWNGLCGMVADPTLSVSSQQVSDAS